MFHAGKSTLALSLLRMVEPAGGKILCVARLRNGVNDLIIFSA